MMKVEGVKYRFEGLKPSIVGNPMYYKMKVSNKSTINNFIFLTKKYRTRDL